MNNGLSTENICSGLIAKYRGSYLCCFLMYMFYYFGMAMFSALISVYLMDKGYNASEVSTVVSASLVMLMIIQPVVGWLNDRYSRKVINSASLSISAVMGILFILSRNLLMTAASYSLGVAFLNATNPVIEKMATTSKYRYSSIRIWGTIGYAVGSQTGGIIYSRISPESMYIFFVISMVLCITGFLGTREEKEADSSPSANKTPDKLCITKDLVIYILIACLFYGTANLNGVYLPAMYTGEGLTVDQASLVLFLGTMMELPVIMLSGFYMNRLANSNLLRLAFIFLIVQFGTYWLIPIVPVQIAVTILTRSTVTMAFIMINLKVIASIVDNSHQMTALAMVSTIKSLVCIGFQEAGGLLVDHYSYRILYAVLSVISAAGLIITLLYRITDGNDKKMFS